MPIEDHTEFIIWLHYLLHAKNILQDLYSLLYRIPPEKIAELQAILDKKR